MLMLQRNALGSGGSSECALCRRRSAVFYCAQCTSDQLQQRRTMLAALQADVAVLRKKTEFALNSKSPLADAERRLDACMKKVELLAERVIQARERLCSDRIALVERTSEFEQRSERVEHGQQRLRDDAGGSSGLHVPLLECLDLQVDWANDHAARVRGEKIRDVFALFALGNPELESSTREPVDAAATTTTARPLRPRRRTYFHTIVSLPLPISGRYDVMPPEVVAGALGKVIHLLTLLAKYLRLTYPHPMVFNGSFSTIGNTSEGAGCHTLYPDGSVGFDRGVAMLHENVAYLCETQGVAADALHPTDILGNLLLVHQSSALGRIQEGSAAPSHSTKPESLRGQLGQSAFLLDRSQTLHASAEILPEYSMV